MMYTSIVNAVSFAEAAGKKIISAIKKGNSKYLKSIENMYLQDDILSHESFR